MCGPIEVGHFLAPLALVLVLKISLVAAAALAALRLLGPARPGLVSLLLAAALVATTFSALLGGESLRPAPTTKPFYVIIPTPGGFSMGQGSGAALGAAGGEDLAVPPARAKSADLPVGVDWAGIFGLAWLAGVLAILARSLWLRRAVSRRLSSGSLAIDPCRASLASLCRRDVGLRRDVSVRFHPGSASAIVMGLVRQRVILPAEAQGWDDERFRSTLLHEFAHIKARDNLLSLLLGVAATLAWPSPLPRLALRSARVYREMGCDLVALDCGISPSRYAAQLLAAARALAARERHPSCIASQRGGNLDRRIRAVLSWRSRGHRSGTASRAAFASLLLAGAFCLCLVFGSASSSFASWSGPAFPYRDASVVSWPAVLERGATPQLMGAATFALARSPFGATVALSGEGRSCLIALADEQLPSEAPIKDRARSGSPAGSDLGDAAGQFGYGHEWRLWGDRPSPVSAAGGGLVDALRFDSSKRLTIEIDHGGGLRTLYTMPKYAVPLVSAGTPVRKGERIALLGLGQPDDIPFVDFSVLLRISSGEVYALDPAPFVLGSAGTGAAWLGASVLNAAVRSGDGAEVKRLAALGVDVNSIAVDGTLPLEWAVIYGNAKVAALLARIGADPLRATAGNLTNSIAGIGAAFGYHRATIDELARETGEPALIAAIAPK
ncbi:MAG TPA: M56 family metallopeptidase [Rectinemataceae bacterium]|nr:M56 family metallopeptidase [Rectinemataceae bacterium]